MMDEVPEKKIVSVYFSPALFSPLFTHDMVMQAPFSSARSSLEKSGLARSSLVLHMQI